MHDQHEKFRPTSASLEQGDSAMLRVDKKRKAGEWMLES